MEAVALVVSTMAVIVSIWTFCWTSRRDRKQATLDAYNRLQEQALDHLNGYTPKQLKDIASNPQSEEYKQVSVYIARIEHFCVGVNQKIYDNKVVYDLAHGYLDGAIKSRITPIIEKKNRSGRDYYANIHLLYREMEREQKKRREM
jgi:hypothetical protein